VGLTLFGAWRRLARRRHGPFQSHPVADGSGHRGHSHQHCVACFLRTSRARCAFRCWQRHPRQKRCL